MKINWIALTIVAIVSFFVPGGLLAASSDHSGAGMVGLGYLVIVIPSALLVAIVAQVLTLNTRFRAYPGYALIGILSSALGVLFLV